MSKDNTAEEKAKCPCPLSPKRTLLFQEILGLLLFTMKALQILEIHQHLRSYSPSGFPPRNMNISFCILMLKNVDTHSPRQQISCCHHCMASEGTSRGRQKALTSTWARVGAMPPSCATTACTNSWPIRNHKQWTILLPNIYTDIPLYCLHVVLGIPVLLLGFSHAHSLIWVCPPLSLLRYLCHILWLQQLLDFLVCFSSVI